MAIQPIGERVLLKPKQQETKTAGGIYIPDAAQETKKEGTVVALGQTNISLQPGDTVLYGGYSNEEFERDGTTYVVVEAKDILAKVD
ncbi:MAG: co-chaperone GroES [Candidatus Woesearchaeota archaeon]|nr:co-chaperone GroES [Candidatus Woesearchaeota archaeon]